VGSIIASVVSSIQTSTAPPQCKVLSMKSLPMDLSSYLIIILVNFFQLILSHRQLRPINLLHHRPQLARGERYLRNK
jgi:hypothetical protein